MNILKKIYCRIFQFAFRLAQPILPYREPKTLSAVADIALELKNLNIKSVLLVTDGFLRENHLTDKLESELAQKNIHCAVYDKTKPNPTVNNVEEAFSLYKKENCTALIAFGGGSPIDCAKAVGARAAYPKKSLEKLKGLLKVRRQIPVLFAIPTTAGTGSEVTVTSVITDSESKHKYTMNAFSLIPHYAVHDPEVTYSLPQSLTATTGMDAMTHAVEAYIGQSTTKETRRLSEEAVKLIFENIETAYSDPTNKTARENMLKASYMAGIAFSKSYVGYIHAVAHSLGGQYNIPHGLANSVLMPIVLEDYGDCINCKLHRLATASGIASQNDLPKDAARKFVEKIKDLNRKLNIPETLSGIRKEDISKMAIYADREANPLYPVPKLMNHKELEKYYHKVADWR